VQVGEVALGALRSLERALVGLELDQVSRDEARREAALAQDLHEQPRAVAARARAALERLLGALTPGSMRIRYRISRTAGGSGRTRKSTVRRGVRETAASRCARRGPTGESSRNGRSSRSSHGSYSNGNCSAGLEEEVERILHRQLGDQVDLERELAHLSGNTIRASQFDCGSCCQFTKWGCGAIRSE
jgi:hypothetical protein